MALPSRPVPPNVLRIRVARRVQKTSPAGESRHTILVGATRSREPSGAYLLQLKVSPEGVAGDSVWHEYALIEAQCRFAAGELLEVDVEFLPCAAVGTGRNHAFFENLIIRVNGQLPSTARLTASLEGEAWCGAES